VASMKVEPSGEDAGTRCLSEDRLLDHLAARPGEEGERVAEHIDGCPRCQTLVAEAARSLFLPGGGHVGAAHTPRTLSQGELAQGRYEIRRFLGSGGMGEVYEAFDNQLHEMVALKTLACTALDDKNALRRLKTEVYLARKVTHPNVCRILEFGFYERRQGGHREEVSFLTMELLRGEPLGRRIAREGPLSPAEAVPILRQIVDGLAAVHAAGIVHRDLKSENVFLVDQPPRVVLMDFGLANRKHSSRSNPLLSSGGGGAGTPGYTAPELILGAPASVSSDVYSLGTVMFEVLTGSLPFGGDTPVEVAMARIDGPPPPPSSRIADLAPALDSLVLKCLARDPADRFASTREIAAELEAGLREGEALAASPAGPPILSLGSRRRVVLLVAAVMLAVAFLVLAVLR
jgi:serine/threonine protein kinase